MQDVEVNSTTYTDLREHFPFFLTDGKDTNALDTLFRDLAVTQ